MFAAVHRHWFPKLGLVPFAASWCTQESPDNPTICGIVDREQKGSPLLTNAYMTYNHF